MSDRKKVILDNLEHCRKNQNSNDCQSCEYGGRSFQICERLVDDIIILLKEQEEQKQKWLNRISDAQITVSPTGFESEIELAKRTGEWNGLQMAFDILTETGGEVE